MLISVVMPSFLGAYDGAAENREQSFLKAVRSFLNNTLKEKELVVVSDGCSKTVGLLDRHFYSRRDIKGGEYMGGLIRLVILEKQPLFSGVVRQAGLDAAVGNLITYLDSDDELAPQHLEVLAAEYSEAYDWYYFNAFYKLKEFGDVITPFPVALRKGEINTGCFAHKKNVNARWDTDINGAPNIGVGENFRFVEQLIKNHPNKKHIFGLGYFINHYSVSIFQKEELKKI